MSEVTPADDCREIERHLCRRNGGHLVRIVGPAFEKVTGWARQGIPVKVAFQGIDRMVDREAAKGPKRRPVRIEFCEADVLDAFDDWRRAVGAELGRAVSVPEAGPTDDAESTSKPRRVALQGHIDRVMGHLTQRRLAGELPAVLLEATDRALAALDRLRGGAHGARGARRDALHAELLEIEGWLDGAARLAVPSELVRLEAEARTDLQPFRARMPAQAFEEAVVRETSRQLRTMLRLPQIAAGL